MKLHKTCQWIAVVCLALGASFAFPRLVSAADKAKPSDTPAAEKPLYADLEGQVVDEGGNPIPGVVVNLLYETSLADENGKFRFQKIPTIHTSVVSLQVANDSGMVIGCTSFDIPVRYYPVAASEGDRVDVVIAEPGVDTFVTLKLKSVTIDKVNDYCSACHTKNPCVETTTFGSMIKKDDKKLRGLIVKESELPKVRENFMKLGLSKDSYRYIRHQDTHPDNFEMNQAVAQTGERAGLFKQPEKLKMRVIRENNQTRHYVICDSCHTRHLATEQRQFVVMAFDEESQLCYQCHN
ncbi:hypothetical protein EPN96_03080 [bacterium]|nr:MAG: hypothetical protein EPN96_03080 [bacterium]